MIGRAPSPALPVVSVADAVAALPGIDLWDMWPLQYADGTTAQFDGGELWIALSAPPTADPGDRHGIARMRLLRFDGAAWNDCGILLPEGLAPGSREWAGSTIVDRDHQVVTVYFTAAGQRGDAQSTFEQRLFETTGRLTRTDGRFAGTDWSTPVESVVSDGNHYVRAVESDGQPGHIKAFRDPAFFRDPADGRDYLLFTGSAGRSGNAFNGVVGIAERSGQGWSLLPPLVSADGLNNELERPHIVVHGGGYYLFWSTQRRVFAPGGPDGPNGLYGMVAPTLFGPYRPLNGSGLVAANPPEEPLQAYSWWVTASLEVASFIDHWGLAGRSFDMHPVLLRSQFGGTPAPRFRLALSGDRATIVR